MEKNLWTGESVILNKRIEGNIRNLQYGPGDDDISYVREEDEDSNIGDIYTYDLDDDVEQRIIGGCLP